MTCEINYLNETGKGTMVLDNRMYNVEVAAHDKGKVLRFFVYPDETNSMGERITLEFSLNEWGEKCSLWDAWVKHGWIEKKDSLVFLYTYVTDAEGRCWGKYNPQHKWDGMSHRAVVDFDWILEAKPAGIKALIDETMKRFS